MFKLVQVSYDQIAVIMSEVSQSAGLARNTWEAPSGTLIILLLGKVSIGLRCFQKIAFKKWGLMLKQ